MDRLFGGVAEEFSQKAPQRAQMPSLNTKMVHNSCTHAQTSNRLLRPRTFGWGLLTACALEKERKHVIKVLN